MKKPIVTGNPILDRVALIDKRYIEELDPEAVPKDPQEFLDWWWKTSASICEACPLSETRTRVVRPDGVASADIMIVGEGPGFMEDLVGIPMVGPLELRYSHCGVCKNNKACFSHKLKAFPMQRSGKNKAVECNPNYTGKREFDGSRFFIQSAGSIVGGILIHKWNFNYPRHNWFEAYNKLHPDDPWTHKSPWFVTNITLCRTTDVTKLKDSPPDGVPRQKCKRHLAMQWAAVNPKLIVCFGRVALSVLMGAEERSKSVTPNSIVETKFGPVLFQNHPAFFMREQNREVKAFGFAKVAATLAKALEYVGYPTK
jgi:uracil-DNA glycosylase